MWHGNNQPNGNEAFLRLGRKSTDKGHVTSIASVLPVSRAVVRFVEAGNDAVCEHCHLPVKFMARVKCRQVIANVYDDGRWQRVEHFHETCYSDAAEPYGPARP